MEKLDFTKGRVTTNLGWTAHTLVVSTAAADRAGDGHREIDLASEPAALESMQRVEENLTWAANVLVAAGFAERPGRDLVSADPTARLSWNLAYAADARRWIEGDPEWKRIGGAARCAADLLDAGVGIQMAAMGVRDGRLPVTSAVALHNLSVVFGAMRVHLDQWLEGTPQKLADQRVRAAGLKTASWYPSVESVIREGLDANDKIDAIAAEALARLRTIPRFASNLPTHDAVRMKIQRIRNPKAR